MKKLIFAFILLMSAVFAQDDSIVVNVGSMPLKFYMTVNPTVGKYFPGGLSSDGAAVPENVGSFGFHAHQFKVKKGVRLAVAVIRSCQNDTIKSVTINQKKYTQISSAYNPIDSSKMYESGGVYYFFIDSTQKSIQIDADVGTVSSMQSICDTMYYMPNANGNIKPYLQMDPSGTQGGLSYTVIERGSDDYVNVQPAKGYYLKTLYAAYEGSGKNDTLFEHPYIYNGDKRNPISYWNNIATGSPFVFGDSIFFYPSFAKTQVYAEFALKPNVPVKLISYGPDVSHPLIGFPGGKPAGSYTLYPELFCWKNYRTENGNFYPRDSILFCDMNVERSFDASNTLFLWNTGYGGGAASSSKRVWKNRIKIYDRSDTLNFPRKFKDTVQNANDVFEFYYPASNSQRIMFYANANEVLSDSSHLFSMISSEWSTDTYYGMNYNYISADTLKGMFENKGNYEVMAGMAGGWDSTITWNMRSHISREILSLKVKGECYDPNTPWNGPTPFEYAVPPIYWQQGQISGTEDSISISGIPKIDSKNCGSIAFHWDIKAIPVNAIPSNQAKNQLSWSLKQKNLTLNSSKAGKLLLLAANGKVLGAYAVKQGLNQLNIQEQGLIVAVLQVEQNQELLFKKVF